MLQGPALQLLLLERIGRRGRKVGGREAHRHLYGGERERHSYTERAEDVAEILQIRRELLRALLRQLRDSKELLGVQLCRARRDLVEPVCVGLQQLVVLVFLRHPRLELLWQRHQVLADRRDVPERVRAESRQIEGVLARLLSPVRKISNVPHLHLDLVHEGIVDKRLDHLLHRQRTLRRPRKGVVPLVLQLAQQRPQSAANARVHGKPLGDGDEDRIPGDVRSGEPKRRRARAVLLVHEADGLRHRVLHLRLKNAELADKVGGHRQQLHHRAHILCRASILGRMLGHRVVPGVSARGAVRPFGAGLRLLAVGDAARPQGADRSGEAAAELGERVVRDP
mmetsp:Transcript_17072/g.40730  ORF Transcript_17072/g.40730 Transcript_17072/m.40730 type:complete len:339 (-) Transcript_17072:1431-2447(-)